MITYYIFSVVNPVALVLKHGYKYMIFVFTWFMFQEQKTSSNMKNITVSNMW